MVSATRELGSSPHRAELGSQAGPLYERGSGLTCDLSIVRVGGDSVRRHPQLVSDWA